MPPERSAAAASGRLCGLLIKMGAPTARHAAYTAGSNCKESGKCITTPRALCSRRASSTLLEKSCTTGKMNIFALALVGEIARSACKRIFCIALYAEEFRHFCRNKLRRPHGQRNQCRGADNGDKKRSTRTKSQELE